MTGESDKFRPRSRPAARRLRAAMILACCLLVPLASPRAATAGLMTVHEVVNVRSEPDVHSPKAARLMPGDAVLAHEAEGDWRAVSDLSGRPLGHVHAPLLVPFGEGAPGLPMTVDAVVNVRRGPGTDSPRVTRLVPGQAVLASEEHHGWSAVSDASGRALGYAHAPLLRPVALAQAAPGAAPAADPSPAAPSRPDPGGWKITVTPSITQALAYDDNILFLDVADLESRTSPGLAVKLEDDRTTLDAQAVLDILRYQTHDELDRHNTRLSASARHALSRRFDAGINGSYTHDHSIETSSEETGLIVGQSPKRRREVVVDCNYSPLETTLLHAVTSTYDSTHASNERNNSHGGALGLDLRQGLDEQTSLLVSGHSRRYEYEEISQVVNGALAGAGYKISEELEASLMLGSDVVTTDTEGDTSHSDAHLAAEADLRWAYERGKLELGASRMQLPTQSGENITRTVGHATLRQDLSERLAGIFSGRLLRSQSERYQGSADSRAYSLSPTLRYLFEDGHCEVGYTYNSNTNLATGEQKHSNRLEIRLCFEFSELF